MIKTCTWLRPSISNQNQVLLPACGPGFSSSTVAPKALAQSLLARSHEAGLSLGRRTGAPLSRHGRTVPVLGDCGLVSLRSGHDQGLLKWLQPADDLVHGLV